MIELGEGLVPSSPARPRQHRCDRLLDDEDHFPQQATDLGHAESNQSPRRALKLARLLAPARRCSPFFGSSASAAAARIIVSTAWAHIASLDYSRSDGQRAGASGLAPGDCSPG